MLRCTGIAGASCAHPHVCTDSTMLISVCCVVHRFFSLETVRSRTWRLFKYTRTTVRSLLEQQKILCFYHVRIQCLQKHLLKHVHPSPLISTFRRTPKVYGTYIGDQCCGCLLWLFQVLSWTTQYTERRKKCDMITFLCALSTHRLGLWVGEN